MPDLNTLKASTEASDRAIANLAGTGLAAAATGEDAFVRSNEGMTRVNQLVTQIDSTPDLKASVDLNTRVLVEVNQQLNEMLRVMAANASASGVTAVTTARDLDAARNFLKIGAN